MRTKYTITIVPAYSQTRQTIAAFNWVNHLYNTSEEAEMQANKFRKNKYRTNLIWGAGAAYTIEVLPVQLNEYQKGFNPHFPEIYYALYDRQTGRHLCSGANSKSREELAKAYVEYVSIDMDDEDEQMFKTLDPNEVLAVAYERDFIVDVSFEPFDVD